MKIDDYFPYLWYGLNQTKFYSIQNLIENISRGVVYNIYLNKHGSSNIHFSIGKYTDGIAINNKFFYKTESDYDAKLKAMMVQIGLKSFV